jgi:hypothetical protein
MQPLCDGYIVLLMVYTVQVSREYHSTAVNIAKLGRNQVTYSTKKISIECRIGF